MRTRLGMKFDREQGSSNFIRSYVAGTVHVGERAFTGPFIISADSIIDDWSPPDIAMLAAGHLQPALALEPEVILLGTGERQRFPPAALGHAVLGLGIGIEAMDTAAACRTFNVLVSEYRRVVAILYPR